MKANHWSEPDIAFFAAVARRSGTPPPSALLIDDTPANVEGARAAGWQALCFTGPAALREELARRGVLASR